MQSAGDQTTTSFGNNIYIVSIGSDSSITKRTVDDSSGTTSLTLKWRIPRFEQLFRTGQDSGLSLFFKTPVFASDEDGLVRWYVSMVTSGTVSSMPTVVLDSSSGRQGFFNLIMSLHLDLGSNVPKVTATFDCQNQEKYLFLSSPFLRTDVIKRDVYPEKSKNSIGGLILRAPVLPNGDICINCNLKTEGTDVIAMRDIASLSKLSEDLASLYANQSLSDVTIIVKNETILASKAILAARSPVLAALFENKLLEARKNEIVITDAEPEAFKDFLYYLYTGKTLKITELTDQLLTLADKYQVVHLRDLCQALLMKKITRDNVLPILVLAELHNAKELKSEAIKFVNLSWETVCSSDDWKDFVSSYPMLLNEIFLESKKLSRDIPK